MFKRTKFNSWLLSAALIGTFCLTLLPTQNAYAMGQLKFNTATYVHNTDYEMEVEFDHAPDQLVAGTVQISGIVSAESAFGTLGSVTVYPPFGATVELLITSGDYCNPVCHNPDETIFQGVLPLSEGRFNYNFALENAQPLNVEVIFLEVVQNFEQETKTYLGSSSSTTLAIVEPRVVDIGSDYIQTYALLENGEVRSWPVGEAGAHFFIDLPEDLGVVSTIAASGVFNSHMCVIQENRGLRCWGANEFGQATVPEDLGQVMGFSVGQYHTCAIQESGNLRCWGGNVYGRARVPDDLGGVVSVATSLDCTTCAIKFNGLVRCWGEEHHAHHSGIVAVPENMNPVTAIAMGRHHVCALEDTGSVVCWGQNYRGQTTVPEDLGTVVAVVAAPDHTCVIEEHGSIKCWGAEDMLYGPIVPEGLGPVVDIATSYNHTTALLENGKLTCWGWGCALPFGLQ